MRYDAIVPLFSNQKLSKMSSNLRSTTNEALGPAPTRPEGVSPTASSPTASGPTARGRTFQSVLDPSSRAGTPSQKHPFLVRVLLTLWLLAKRVFRLIFPVILWGATKYVMWCVGWEVELEWMQAGA